MDRWASKRTNDNSFGFIVDEERSRVWSFRFCTEREDMDTCQVTGECWGDRQVGPCWVGLANGSGAVARDIFAVYGFKLNLID